MEEMNGGRVRTNTGHRLRRYLNFRAMSNLIIYIVITILCSLTIYTRIIDKQSAGAAQLTQSLGDKESAYPIAVGLNTKYLKGQYIAVYDDTIPALKPGDLILLTNDNHPLHPTVLLEVEKVIHRKDDPSAGAVFVSREATDCLQIFKRNPGIVKLTMRKVGPQKTASSDSPFNITVPISFNLGLRK